MDEEKDLSALLSIWPHLSERERWQVWFVAMQSSMSPVRLRRRWVRVRYHEPMIIGGA